ncbi:MAG: phosphoribosylamine--glycine ligase [Rhodothermales bacterium]|nr:phosphoribosylamine--glycine ligase [Rhodothermales bacterium]
MRILVIGGGGRAHALCHALARSARRPTLYCAPGNAGTAALAENVPLAATDLDGLLRFARERAVDLTVVGPEAPLVAGLADRFREAGLRVLGPSAAAARLEGSKSFANAFMERHGVPTAASRTFTTQEYDAAVDYVEKGEYPLVVKADGLAAGKGVRICADADEAREALRETLVEGEFGQAGAQVVIEAFLHGEEASVFALTDGEDYVLLAPAQDHKRVGEGDTGPNTGGMGAYAPAPVVTPEVLQQVEERIVQPTLAGMVDEGYPYQGVLYCGLMITADGPEVVEFNARFGDPEAQVVLPLLDADVADLFLALTEGRLGDAVLGVRDGAAACVVLASGGYPGPYEKGKPISGLDAVPDDVLVFHAGTAVDEDGRTVTAGGRVLGVTGLGDDLQAALERAYAAVDQIAFEGVQVRRDIGQKGLARLAALPPTPS